MNHPFSFLLKPTVLLLTLATANAATVTVSTNFAALPDGPVTQAALNGVTSGGTWFWPNRGATYEIQDDNGDKAVLADDLSGNGGVITLIALTASAANAVDLTTHIGTFNFRTGTRRTGNDKGLRYQFVNQDNSAIIATLDWLHNGNQLVLNAGALDEHSVTQGVGERFSSSFLGAWDADSDDIYDVSVTFSGSTVTATFGSETLTSSFLNPATDIGRLQVQTIGSATAAKGAFLDDVTLSATLIPEPSIGILALLGLGTLLRRRR
ncbi:MAG: hypothetical protein ABJQ29_08620 [Luteolibacter sp.]